MPIVTLVAPTNTTTEGNPTPAKFRLTRSGDTAADLTVSFGLSGSATPSDYTASPALAPTSIVIPVSENFVNINITAIDGSDIESSETLTLTLADGAAYDLGTIASASITIADNDAPVSVTRIRDIQGAAHLSPLVGQSVSNVPGIVTVVQSNGFYLQDPTPDANDATSEGIFVFTASAPTVTIGGAVAVNGTVSEFHPGGSSGTNNLTTTQITSSAITIQSTGNPLPSAIVLGNGGRAILTTVIEDDATSSVGNER